MRDDQLVRAFEDPADKPRDVVSNVLLFVPFGWSYSSARRGHRAPFEAIGLALVISAGAEATQLFSTLRYPSATDVLMAVLGTVAGIGGEALWPLP